MLLKRVGLSDEPFLGPNAVSQVAHDNSVVAPMHSAGQQSHTVALLAAFCFPFTYTTLSCLLYSCVTDTLTHTRHTLGFPLIWVRWVPFWANAKIEWPSVMEEDYRQKKESRPRQCEMLAKLQHGLKFQKEAAELSLFLSNASATVFYPYFHIKCSSTIKTCQRPQTWTLHKVNSRSKHIL